MESSKQQPSIYRSSVNGLFGWYSITRGRTSLSCANPSEESRMISILTGYVAYRRPSIAEVALYPQPPDKATGLGTEVGAISRHTGSKAAIRCAISWQYRKCSLSDLERMIGN